MRKHTSFALGDLVPDDPFRATSVPIYQTATFEQESAEGFGRYDYARSGNPTRGALERHCAHLEGGARGLAFASGVAAIAAVTRLLKPGDELLAHRDLYGGSHRLFSRLLAERGVTVRYADLVDGEPAAWRAHCSPRTRLVFVESITNPLLRVPDLAALARAAHEVGALLAVDATAMSPWLQRPLSLGADLVVHSATKLLNGHADATAGIVVTREEALGQELAFVQNAEGGVLGPFESWLVLRGLATLGVRVDRQVANATRVAAWLAERSERQGDVRRVRFPGLADHPDRERIAAQAEGPGVVISFETGDEERSIRLVESLERFSIAVSFGSVASTASLPCRMSHASIPAHERTLPGDLVRLSIGLEDPEDLISDLERACRLAAESARLPSDPLPVSPGPHPEQAARRASPRSAAGLLPHPRPRSSSEARGPGPGATADPAPSASW